MIAFAELDAGSGIAEKLDPEIIKSDDNTLNDALGVRDPTFALHISDRVHMEPRRLQLSAGDQIAWHNFELPVRSCHRLRAAGPMFSVVPHRLPSITPSPRLLRHLSGMR